MPSRPECACLLPFIFQQPVHLCLFTAFPGGSFALLNQVASCGRRYRQDVSCLTCQKQIGSLARWDPSSTSWNLKGSRLFSGFPHTCPNQPHRRIEDRLSFVAMQYTGTSVLSSTQNLEDANDNPVLGADIAESSVGSMSSIQDIEIPPHPSFTELDPRNIIALLQRFVATRPFKATDNIETIRSLDKVLPQILNFIRLDMMATAEIANDAFVDGAGVDSVKRAVQSLMWLLHSARFHTESPASLSPPSLTTLPVHLSSLETMDPSLFGDACFASHPLLSSRVTTNAVFPNILICTRGTGILRSSGPLYGVKMRSIEHLYLGWVDTPLRLMRKLFLRPRTLLEPDVAQTQECSSRKVRRVFPTTKIQFSKGPSALLELTLPIITQEPTHQMCAVAYREYQPDRKLQRRAWMQDIENQLRMAFSKAVDPVKHSAKQAHKPRDHRFSPPLGKRRRLRLELYRDVPWGDLIHLLPSSCITVVLRARDILRLDLLTLAGLVSLSVNMVRDVDQVFIAASAIGTAIVYTSRIVLALRQALVSTRFRISGEKASRIVAVDEAAIATLSSLAANQLFAVGAAIYAGHLLGVDSAELAKRVLKVDIRDNVDEWTRRLSSWGFIHS